MTAPRPYTLVAELTYRCPLRCAYCSNPVAASERGPELDGPTWCRIVSEAEALGVVQLNLTGGEPLLRPELEDIVAAAQARGLYVNLITSGVPLERARLAGLAARGLASVQISLQDTDGDAAAASAGRDVLVAKLRAAAWVRALDLPLTINVVLHRDNIARVPAFIALAEELGADRLELANTQYLGWALANRDRLMPAPGAIEAAREKAEAARARLAGRMEILFVLPDHHMGRPRACMGGWARSFIVVSPSGLVLPCQAAHGLPGLRFDDVRTRPLAEVWHTSAALARFRGEDWMQAPCRTCPERARDFGGCRCQAFHLAGDAAAPDPACRLAPAHDVVAAAVARAAADDRNGGKLVPLVPRRVPTELAQVGMAPNPQSTPRGRS